MKTPEEIAQQEMRRLFGGKADWPYGVFNTMCDVIRLARREAREASIEIVKRHLYDTEDGVAYCLSCSYHGHKPGGDCLVEQLERALAQTGASEGNP